MCKSNNKTLESNIQEDRNYHLCQEKNKFIGNSNSKMEHYNLVRTGNGKSNLQGTELEL
jgi:hypothetical protein